MRSARGEPAGRAPVWIVAALVCVLAGLSAGAQEVQHLSITQPGGMPGRPVMTGIQRATNGVTVTWDGPAGYYQVYQSASLKNPQWQAVGRATNLAGNASITALYSNAFFRVLGPSPQYVGSQACAECHPGIHDTEMNTRHAGAFTDASFKAEGGQTNGSCLPCHTVGYGLPTGFVSASDFGSTNRLAGVQCENCHGPAGNHAANPDDPTVRPRVEIAATVCGGCHTDTHHPTFDEWKASEHAEVTEPGLNPNTCGRCHLGSARVALVKNQPVPQNDSSLAVVCVVCHDPHANHVWTNGVSGSVYTNQVRNPYTSTNDYFLTTSGVFTNQYNPSVNICAQCHNHRGADWRNSDRAPHHSPQYNMLLGTVGVLPAGVVGGPATHAGTRFITNSLQQAFLVTNQCVTCHMQSRDYQQGPPEIAAVTGHRFEVNLYDACAGCHGSGPNAQGLAALLSLAVSNQVQQVKENLDLWAVTKAPDQLRTNYGTRAWEYTSPGDLSPGGSGPNGSEQTNLVPVNIRMARFDLYLVLYDGSYGVHNAPYAFTLLDAAANWVEEELNP